MCFFLHLLLCILCSFLQMSPTKHFASKKFSKRPRTVSRPKPDTRICDHDRHANIKFKPDINKNQLNFYKTFPKASLFLFILVSLLLDIIFHLIVRASTSYSKYNIIHQSFNFHTFT